MKILAILYLFLTCSVILTQDLNSIISQVETDIISLRDATEAAFTGRCTLTSDCSYHMCSDNPAKATCNSNFVTAYCSCFTPEGTNLYMDAPTVKLADVFSPYVSENNQRVREIVRTGQALTPLFKSLNQKNADYKWLYFGSSNGVWIEYPSTCVSSYDNRYNSYLQSLDIDHGI